MFKARSLLPLILLLVCSGCESPFPSATLVERLRILAIKAEPSAVGLEDTVELQSLVADPQGQGRQIHYTWAVCFVEIQSLAVDIACPGPESYPIQGDSPSVSLSMPDLVAWLLEKGISLEIDPSDFPPDIPIDEIPKEIPMLIGLEVKVDGQTTRTIKRVKVLLEADQVPNRNPVLTGLELEGELLDFETVVLNASEKYELTPLVADDSQEWFTMEGETEDRLEDHLFSWYTTGGEFIDRRTILDVDKHGEPLEVNELQTPDEQDQYDIWLIVRDGRYGVDWLQASFAVATE